jgi:hypothetical protein
MGEAVASATWSLEALSNGAQGASVNRNHRARVRAVAQQKQERREQPAVLLQLIQRERERPLVGRSLVSETGTSESVAPVSSRV